MDARWQARAIRDNRLSSSQAGLLLLLLDAYRVTESAGGQVGVWGIRIHQLPDGTSRSKSAALSRSLRRLEDRGLVERRNQATGDQYSKPGEVDPDHVRLQHRTTHVRLTGEGRALAERLTDGPTHSVNRP
jgi:hypothetical protein